MRVHAINPILNVSDVPASIRWFEKLGWHRGFAWNAGGMIQGDALENTHGPATFGSMCAFPSGPEHGPQIFLCKDGQGQRDPHTPASADDDNFGAVWMSWWVDDVDAAHAECARAGVEVVRPPVNEPWNVRECLIRHPDGHCFRISGPVK
jgi:catechol 2,3-dioxygenase-like lactoylglutathione lyase family enzyme